MRVPSGVWVALIVLLLGVGPWLELIPQLPWGPDAVKWIERSATDRPGWAAWDLGSRHFVGYRPVAALSFSLNHAVFGFEPWAYRLVDIFLHALGGGFVWLLYRQWTGDRSVVGLVPVLLMLGHPAVEEVVPFVARRSYLLASVLGLAGLWCLGAAAQAVELGRRHRWGMAAALGLGGAVLSHEAAYVLVPLVPLVLWHQARRGQVWPTMLAGVWVPVVAAYALLARHQAMGSLGGGYVKRYFATLTMTGPTWRELLVWQPRRIAEACWSYLVLPHGPTGDRSWLAGEHDAAWVLLVAITISGWCAVRPILRPEDRAARSASLAGLWLVGATLLVVFSQTWFWRQASLLLAPMGIVLATMIRAAWTNRGIDGVAGLGAMVALGGMLAQGPLLQGGMSAAPHRARLQGTATLERVRAQLQDLPSESRVYLVLADRGRTAGHVAAWAQRLDAPLEVRVLAHLSTTGDRRRMRAHVRHAEGRRLLVLEGPSQAANSEHVRRRRFDDRGGPLRTLRSLDRPVWLVFVGARTEWRKPINGRPRSPRPGPERAGGLE